jgi:hypothetical protein
VIAQGIACGVGAAIFAAFYFRPALAFAGFGLLFFLTLAAGFIVEPLPRKDHE